MDPSEDTAVQDFLEILEEHRKNCERQGKYVEAEIAKNRLDELKLHEENRRRVSLLFGLLYDLFCPIFKTALFCFLLLKTTTGGDAIASDCRATGRGRGTYA